MAKDILNQAFGTRIIKANGSAETEFYTLLNALVELEVLSGSGSPEGQEAANPTTLYMDTAGTAGNILYIKRDADDGAGDRRFGWILV